MQADLEHGRSPPASSTWHTHVNNRLNVCVCFVEESSRGRPQKGQSHPCVTDRNADRSGTRTDPTILIYMAHSYKQSITRVFWRKVSGDGPMRRQKQMSGEAYVSSRNDGRCSCAEGPRQSSLLGTLISTICYTETVCNIYLNLKSILKWQETIGHDFLICG